jgi:hypothetical protein
MKRRASPEADVRLIIRIAQAVRSCDQRRPPRWEEYLLISLGRSFSLDITNTRRVEDSETFRHPGDGKQLDVRILFRLRLAPIRTYSK